MNLQEIKAELEIINQQVATIDKEKKETPAKLLAKIDKLESDIKSYKSLMDRATEEENTKAYSDNKKKLDDARLSIEMYQNKLQSFNEESRNRYSEITNATQPLLDELKEKAFSEYVRSITPVLNELLNLTNEFTDLLSNTEDLKANWDRKVSQFNPREWKYIDMSLYSSVLLLLKYPCTKEVTGEQPQERNNKIFI